MQRKPNLPTADQDKPSIIKSALAQRFHPGKVIRREGVEDETLKRTVKHSEIIFKCCTAGYTQFAFAVFSIYMLFVMKRQ